MERDIAARLRAPFPPEAIGKLPRMLCQLCSKNECEKHKRKTCGQCKGYLGHHTHLDYVGHAHVRERFLEVDPSWTWEPMAFSQSGLPLLDENNGLWIRLTIGGKTMPGYGDAPGKRGGNAVKEAIGDALRNAGQSFGVALDLWKKEPTGQVEPEELPARQIEKARQQTDRGRANELRGQCKLMAKEKGKDIDWLADTFAGWDPQSPGILKADAAAMEKFQEFLKSELDAS